MSLDKSRRILLRQIVSDATHDGPVLIEAVNLLAYEAGSGMRCTCLASLSVRRRLALPLRFRGFHPPREIVGKARERAFKRLAGLANGFAVGR